jgi:hypothetical protein
VHRSTRHHQVQHLQQRVHLAISLLRLTAIHPQTLRKQMLPSCLAWYKAQSSYHCRMVRIRQELQRKRRPLKSSLLCRNIQNSCCIVAGRAGTHSVVLVSQLLQYSL